MGATESDELAGLQRVDCCVFRRLLRATTNASPRSVAQAPALRIFAAEFVALEQPMVARLRGFWPPFRRPEEPDDCIRCRRMDMDGARTPKPLPMGPPAT